MTSGLRLGGLVVALALAAGAPLVAAAADDTATLGLPGRRVERGADGRPQPDRLVRALAGTVTCGGQACARLPGQFAVALGTDYEILDWFGKGALDLAVVPATSIDLLRRDAVGIVTLRLPPDVFASRPAGAVVPPAPEAVEMVAHEAWCRAARAEGTSWEFALALLRSKGASAPECPQGGSAHVESVVVPSHLVGFVEPVDVAARWLGQRLPAWQCDETAPTEAARAVIEETFWTEFLRRTRMTFSRAESDDYLVISRRLAERLGLRASDGPPALPPDIAAVWDRHCRDEARGARAPRPFRSMLVPEPTFAGRPFAFSTLETMELLRRHRELHRHDDVARGEGERGVELALVLPGGGVKAAYQSRLISELYGAGLLRNVAARGPVPDGALSVDYVIGTSGGALLGYFVSRLTAAGALQLDQLLWQRCENKDACRDLESTDVFAYFDLPRYVSGVAIFVIFAVLLWGRSMWGPLAPAPAPRATRGRWRWRLVLMIALPALCLPFAVRYVHGASMQEHIPEVEGFVYAVLAVVVMFADQTLLLDPSRTKPGARWARLVAGGMLVLGALLMLVSASMRRYEPTWRWLDQELKVWAPIESINFEPVVQVGGALVCLGGIAWIIGALVWTAHSPGYSVVNASGFLSGVGVGLLQVFVVLWVVGKLAHSWPDDWAPGAGFSVLELTAEYWIAVLLVSVMTGLLSCFLSRLRWPWSPTSLLAHGIEYLSQVHPNSSIVPRRFMRLALVAAVATGWWNFVMAPGVYGNGAAQRFLRTIEENFTPTVSPIALTAPFIVTANLLESEGARYFAFLPGASDCLVRDRRTGYGAQWRVFAGPDDGRTSREGPTVCEDTRGPWEAELLRRVVFASGSPYPVFPAHYVAKEGRLVDGGYASNVPIDAAQAVGADQVLIIESSNPLGHDEAVSWLRTLVSTVRIQGHLVDDLPRLVAFLWDRSQQLDRISRRDLLVISLAPSRRESRWPSLVQFTRSVVVRMRKVADEDFVHGRRIGMVQSWGRPVFAYSVTVPKPSARLAHGG